MPLIRELVGDIPIDFDKSVLDFNGEKFEIHKVDSKNELKGVSAIVYKSGILFTGENELGKAFSFFGFNDKQWKQLLFSDMKNIEPQGNELKIVMNGIKGKEYVFKVNLDNIRGINVYSDPTVINFRKFMCSVYKELRKVAKRNNSNTLPESLNIFKSVCSYVEPEQGYVNPRQLYSKVPAAGGRRKTKRSKKNKRRTRRS